MINWLFYLDFILAYTTFAEVIIDHRGYRRLICNGFRFGIHYQHKNKEISWRCTTATKHSGRCCARLKTKLINGYEMIKSVNVNHEHDH